MKPTKIAAALALLAGGAAAQYAITQGSRPDATASAGHAASVAPTVHAVRASTDAQASRVPEATASPNRVAAAASFLQVSSKAHSLWLGPSDFQPVGDPRQCALINDGSFLYRNSGPCTVYVARLPLPQGARIEGIDFVGIDNDPNAQVKVGLASPTWERNFTDSNVSVGTIFGNAGSGIEFADVGVNVLASTGSGGRTIDYYSGDAGPMQTLTRYFLVAIELPASQKLSVYGVSVEWRTQYGPTPTRASYRDVPTQHPYFTEIEMLSRAGVTKGCATDRFCPDTPVTRAQMAVFLARANGLYDDTYDDTIQTTPP